MIRIRPLSVATLCLLLCACQTTQRRLEVPSPLALPAKAPPSDTLKIDPLQAAQSTTRVLQTPSSNFVANSIAGLKSKQNLPPLSGQPITVNLANMPLPAFINEVYGNLLHVNFVLDPKLTKQSDLVTLRVTEPQTPAAFYRMVQDVLNRYGIAGIWDGQTLNVVPAKEAVGNDPPILISGRALPDVPESHRPIFQLVELHAVSAPNVSRWLSTAYSNDQLKIDEDTSRNAIVLSGPPELVRQAVAAISVLDRPFLRGSHSRRIEPAFVSADDLSQKLVDVLVSEGYSASTKVGPGVAIIVLPIPSANSLLVFAPDESVLDHVVQWARTIDKPNPTSNKDSLFYYSVSNTKAADIAAIINGNSSGGQQRDLSMGSTNTDGTKKNDTTSSNNGNASQPALAGNDQGKVLVDEPRNALIFRGDPSEWERLLPLIKQMDRAARQVMIEVTIAEVTLDNNSDLGLSWLAKDSHGKYNGSLQFGNLAAGPLSSTGGLSYLVDVAGSNRAQLNARAEDQQVKILSTPRILVMSGHEASIDVGTEVPTITAETSANQQSGGNSNILQSIQYRKTGIILDVTPTVYSDNRVDLDISQEVSEAQPLDGTTGISSPSIFSRSVKTSLSLRDGGSVVLGGLVSDKNTGGNVGVPFLRNIPFVGNLFKTQSKKRTRTELLIMIVPYVIDSDKEAQAVTDAVVSRMKQIDVRDLRKPAVDAAGNPIPDSVSPPNKKLLWPPRP